MAYTEAGPKPKRGTSSRVSKGKKGDLFKESQMHRIKSSKNEPEAVNFGDNCGVWEQVQTGVRPGLSLS